MKRANRIAFRSLSVLAVAIGLLLVIHFARRSPVDALRQKVIEARSEPFHQQPLATPIPSHSASIKASEATPSPKAESLYASRANEKIASFAMISPPLTLDPPQEIVEPKPQAVTPSSKVTSDWFQERIKPTRLLINPKYFSYLRAKPNERVGIKFSLNQLLIQSDNVEGVLRRYPNSAPGILLKRKSPILFTKSLPQKAEVYWFEKGTRLVKIRSFQGEEGVEILRSVGP